MAGILAETALRKVRGVSAAARRLGLTDFLVQPTYYRAVANWLSSALVGQPSRRCVVDIGAALGRFLVELVRCCPHIESALFVEPSPSLYRWAERILSDGVGAPQPQRPRSVCVSVPAGS